MASSTNLQHLKGNVYYYGGGGGGVLVNGEGPQRDNGHQGQGEGYGGGGGDNGNYINNGDYHIRHGLQGVVLIEVGQQWDTDNQGEGYW